MDPALDRPSTIHTEEALASRGPWSFLISALPGGFSRWGVQLILAWAAFQILPALAWAAHLRARLGDSALANEWGDLLSARDIWEIMEAGKLQDSPLGFWTVAIGLAALLWALWAGWKLQARAAGFKAGLLPWTVAIPAALALGLPPLWILRAALGWLFGFLADSGIQGLGWFNLAAAPILKMSVASALMVQWWLCRVDMASQLPKTVPEWRMHLSDSFLRLWRHPVQWGSVVFFGAVLRAGLAFWVLSLAWGWGGEDIPRLLAFAFLQAAVAGVNAWVIGWTLRATALFWKHDVMVRTEIRALEKSVSARRGLG